MSFDYDSGFYSTNRSSYGRSDYDTSYYYEDAPNYASDGISVSPNAIDACVVLGTYTITLALFIIGCVAAAGHMTAVVAGGCAVGLGSATLIFSLYQSCRAKDPVTKCNGIIGIITMLAIVIIGSLGIANIVTARTVGWCVIAPTLFIASCNYLLCCCGVLMLGSLATVSHHQRITD